MSTSSPAGGSSNGSTCVTAHPPASAVTVQPTRCDADDHRRNSTSHARSDTAATQPGSTDSGLLQLRAGQLPGVRAAASVNGQVGRRAPGPGRHAERAQRARPLMRVGLVCPYSLTVPGGVQSQVLGLARELRRQGHEARVLGPCDGPPPEAFVTPLGDSLPTAANGSIAPLAPDASAALRTIRALRDEEFDVVHVHEPMAPGPPMTTVTMRPAPLVGTFHAAGHSASYRVFRPVVLLAGVGRIDRKVVVSEDAMELAQSALGGEYDILFNGVDEEAHRGDSTHADGGTPDDLLLRSPRGAQGAGRAARGVPGAACRSGCGCRATVRRRRRCWPSTPATPHRRGWAGSATRRSSPGCAARGVLRALAGR